MKNLAPRLSQLALLALVSAILIAPPALAQQVPASSAQLSTETASDVLSSYRMLVEEPYKQVTPQALLDAARDAMLAEAHGHGVRITLPALQAGDDDKATISALDQEIQTVAIASHASSTDYAYTAIEGMASAVGDRWTVFMDPADYAKFSDELDPEKISGIGVMIDTDSTSKFVRAMYVVPGTPADRVGIVDGDLFLSVDGTSTKNMKQDEVSRLLRGKPGTTVHIQLAKSASDPGHDVAITRSEVQPPTVIFKMLPGNVAYIYIIAFGRTTPDEFDTALARVKADGARSLVLDLRDNGGGYVDSAIEISSRFIADKPLVTVEERGKDPATIPAPEDTSVDIPTTVLVNALTASASEITAGALQDDGIGTLVGTKTFGKGVMQTLHEFADGSAIKITTAHYLTPAHHDINLRGIEPDVHVAENKNDRFGDLATDSQLRAAVELLQKRVADIKQ